MKIKFYANLRSLVGQPHLDIVDVRVDTPTKLVDRLIELYPEIRPHLLDGNDKLRQDLPIFVNGRNPRLLPMRLETLLTSDDEVSLFSPVASGRLNVESISLQGSRNEN
jgi:molybdopterin converting factor small subunit